MAEILVIGSFVTDMVASVDRFPEEGETLVAKAFSIYPGGKGINQAIAAKRLNGDVLMCGMVGHDTYGDMFCDVLRKEGIDTKFVFRSDKSSTGMAQIQSNDQSSNKIVVISGANLDFDLECVNSIKEEIKNANYVLVQFELPLSSTLEIIEIANKYHKKVILNPAPATHLPLDILKKVDYITPNEVELGALCQRVVTNDEEAIEAAKFLLDEGVKNIIVTLGSRGSLIVNQEITEVIPSFKVKSVDSVGAGDSFNGALAVKLNEGASLREAVIFAGAEGALTVTVKGAVPSLHKREEVEAFLAERLNK